MGGWYELAIAWLVHWPRKAAVDRGQSQVVGAILIFGFVIAGLGLYQVTVVPQQTSEVELDHSTQVKDDFADVHSAITNAGATNDLRTASVKLGTRYPPRALAFNPPPANGRIATEDFSSGISISNAGFTATDICGSIGGAKSITYKSNYNRLTDPGEHGYETSVTYQEANGRIVDSTQVLIQGDTIRLLPLSTGSVSTTSVDSETVEFVGGKTGGSSVSSNLILTLPTQLSKDQWETVLADAENVDSITKPTSDTVEIELQDGEYSVRCTAIGEGEAPGTNPDLAPGSDSSSSPDGVINPSGDGTVAYKSAAMDGDNGVTITFENLDDDERIIKEARVPYYNADGQGGTGGSSGQRVDIKQDDSTPLERVGGPYEERPDVALAAEGNSGDEQELKVTFFCSDDTTDAYTVGQGDYFVLSLKFENSETNNYFINPPSTDPGNSPCSGNGNGNGNNNLNP